MCQLFNLIREILWKRCILVQLCSPSFTLGFILLINQRNMCNLFSQKSSHGDKIKCFILHIYIYLVRCLQILLCLAGKPIALPKRTASQGMGDKGHEFITMQPPFTVMSPSTSSPLILPLHSIHFILHHGRANQNRGRELLREE